jgi:hypothetical protein
MSAAEAPTSELILNSPQEATKGRCSALRSERWSRWGISPCGSHGLLEGALG